MAEAKEELDLDAKQPRSGKKRLFLIILGVLVLIGASIGGTLLIVGGGAGNPEQAAEELRPVPHYLPLDTLVVNFGERGPARYLQVELQMMAHEKAPLAALETHMPVIRNNILMLLSSQKFEEVTTRQGKEKLRNDIRQSVNQVLAEQAEIEEGIKAVYFTSFVMQ